MQLGVMTVENITKEHRARSHLELVLLEVPYLHPFIKSNDKTPIWDGEIHVYRGKKPTSFGMGLLAFR